MTERVRYGPSLGLAPPSMRRPDRRGIQTAPAEGRPDFPPPRVGGRFPPGKIRPPPRRVSPQREKPSAGTESDDSGEPRAVLFGAFPSARTTSRPGFGATIPQVHRKNPPALLAHLKKSLHRRFHVHAYGVKISVRLQYKFSHFLDFSVHKFAMFAHVVHSLSTESRTGRGKVLLRQGLRSNSFAAPSSPSADAAGVAGGAGE